MKINAQKRPPALAEYAQTAPNNIATNSTDNLHWAGGWRRIFPFFFPSWLTQCTAPSPPAGPAAGSERLFCVAEERTGDRVRDGDCLRRSRVRARPRSAGAPQGSPKGPRSTGAQAPTLARRARPLWASQNPPGSPSDGQLAWYDVSPEVIRMAAKNDN